MVRLEATYWPIVAVGAVSESVDDEFLDERAVWEGQDLRLAIVIAGDHLRAWQAQEEVFAWLQQRREHLSSTVSRVAWVFEDEAMRRSAERWLGLLGSGLFHADMMTFCDVRLAVSWLAFDVPTDGWHGVPQMQTGGAGLASGPRPVVDGRG